MLVEKNYDEGEYGDLNLEQQKALEEQNQQVDHEFIEEVGSADESDDSSQENLSLPKNRKLFTEQYRISVKELISMVKDKTLILTPEYQRKAGVWNIEKKSLFIESLLLNVPIPIIYCIESTKDSSWEVIDGLQRISTIVDFYDNRFALKHLQEYKVLEGKRYRDFDQESEYSKVKFTLDRAVLPIVLVQKESDEDIQFDIFIRLNSGAVKLNEQELRNCMYRGKFNVLLRKLSENQDFQSLLPGSPTKNKRFLDVELVLRFFACQKLITKNSNENGIVIDEGYKGSMKNYLTHYMKTEKDIDDIELTKKEQDFTNTISLVKEILGENAFKRHTSDQKLIFNKSLYDVCMVSFFLLGKEKIAKKSSEVKQRIKELHEDLDFVELITNNTNNRQRIEDRFNYWLDQIEEVLK